MDQSNAENSRSKAVRPRWKPTTQQKETLERIYRDGMLSPTREDRERITAVLKHSGSVEEKNVLYWFRNKNAKEREKRKRAQGLSRSITQQEDVSNKDSGNTTLLELFPLKPEGPGLARSGNTDWVMGIHFFRRSLMGSEY